MNATVMDVLGRLRNDGVYVGQYDDMDDNTVALAERAARKFAESDGYLNAVAVGNPKHFHCGSPPLVAVHVEKGPTPPERLVTAIRDLEQLAMTACALLWKMSRNAD